MRKAHAVTHYLTVRELRGIGGNEELRSRLAWMCSSAVVKGATSASGNGSKNNFPDQPFYPPPIARQYDAIVDGACPFVASFGQRDLLNRGSGKKLEQVLTHKGIPNDVKTYPKAGHSFADYAPLQPISRIRGFGQNDAAADDAWQRVFSFFGEHMRVA
jgi:acetyl esterase/lipase